MEKHKIKNLLQKLNDEDRNTLCCLLIKAWYAPKSERSDLKAKGRPCILLNFGRMLMLKNIARKPILRTETYLKYGFVITEHEYHYCPKCNHILNAGPNYQPKYCDQCGQKLNFSRIKWKEDKELGFVKRGEAYESV